MRSKLFYLPAIILITSTFQSCGLFKTAAERNLTYRSIGSYPSKTPPAPPVMYPKDGKNEANLSRSLDASSVSATSIVSMAKTFLGTPYASGGTSKEGTDCSGLVYACFSAAGIKLPRTSRDMAEFGTPVEDKKDIRMGDLVFFDSNNAGKINHVGMVINVAVTDANFIHASSSKGVIESALMTGYWQDKHRKTVRILPIDDFNNPAKYNPSAAAAVVTPKKEVPPKKEVAPTTSTNVPKKETTPSVKTNVPKKETTPSVNTNVPKKEVPVTQPKTAQKPTSTNATPTTPPKKVEPKESKPKTQPTKRLEGKTETEK
jgi:probable lipoprotein NlpC